jgi:hypothetical protein
MLKIVVFFVITILLMSLPTYHDKIIVSHLKKYVCDLTLYNLVKRAKTQCTGFCEQIRVETSTKNGKGCRYVIPLLLSEFKKYIPEHQRDILTYLGFNISQYEKFINDPKITPNSDIIVGIDDGIGKLYLDYGDIKIALKCLESTGKIKFYQQSGKLLKVTTTDQKYTKVSGYHYKLDKPYQNENGDYVYWVAESTDGSKSYYTRPYLPLIDVIDFMHLLGNFGQF